MTSLLRRPAAAMGTTLVRRLRAQNAVCASSTVTSSFQQPNRTTAFLNSGESKTSIELDLMKYEYGFGYYTLL